MGPLLLHLLDDEIIFIKRKYSSMFSTHITLLGLALAVDAGVVSFALGLLHEHEPVSQKIKNGFFSSLIFGFFQFGMIWFGSYAGYVFTFSRFGLYFQFVVGLIFFGIGFKCIKESLSDQERNVVWGLVPVLLLGFATSIDALVSGISLGALSFPYIPALVVGSITFLLCALFYLGGQFFKKVPDQWLLRFAGFIFSVFGFQVFWTMFSRL